MNDKQEINTIKQHLGCVMIPRNLFHYSQKMVFQSFSNQNCCLWKYQCIVKVTPCSIHLGFSVKRFTFRVLVVKRRKTAAASREHIVLAFSDPTPFRPHPRLYRPFAKWQKKILVSIVYLFPMWSTDHETVTDIINVLHQHSLNNFPRIDTAYKLETFLGFERVGIIIILYFYSKYYPWKWFYSGIFELTTPIFWKLSLKKLYKIRSLQNFGTHN